MEESIDLISAEDSLGNRASTDTLLERVLLQLSVHHLLG
jgi:hypothetical protein